jgi:soluble lytic murein transglycosylase-like protein
MRTWKTLLLTAIAIALLQPAAASAAFEHVVGPGESLTSVAAADGLSVYALAVANGISADSQLTAGSSLAIPPQTAVPTDTSAGAYAPASESAPVQSAPAVAPVGAPSGGYLVQPGDTLSAIAARYGTTVSALASANGLDAAGFLLSGATISVSGDAGVAQPVSTESVSPPVAAPVSTSTGVQPTAETVSPSDVGSIAAQNGVSPSLAEAIGYQESGFNNNLVSSTGATGVMQIEPGTWSYIGQSLATPPPLSPSSATDNIRGGVLLLRSLLDQTGGDPTMAAAGYYQGLQSVRAHGMYTDTQQYVNNVMALRQRFGGG